MTDSLDRIRTLSELFRWRTAQSPDREAYREYDAVSGKWVSRSWRETDAAIERWSRALGMLRLPAGARVAILLPNGVNAICADQAALRLGLVPVPMHAIDNPASVAYILADAQASALILSDQAQWEAISGCADVPAALRLVVTTRDIPLGHPSSSSVPVIGLADWLDRAGDEVPPAPTLRESDLAAIVYTSGTMGRPKGVMLSHGNVVSNIRSVLDLVRADEHDIFLSFLPLSHTFERTIGYYLPIAAGCCVAFARSVGQVAEDLRVVRPTVLVSVPRIYERFYSKLQEALAGAPVPLRLLFRQTEGIGWRRFCRRQRLPFEPGLAAPLDALFWLLLEPLVARRVLALFGGRLRLAVSGGAPISQAVTRCFIGLGLPLLQGYGMTETSPVVSANALDDNRPDSVGRPLRGVEVRIAENDELQVRGPNVMLGYWNRPEDSRRAFTEDGWLHTGDRAVIEAGRIRIVGRIKEIIVTSTGEKIAPADLELAMTADPLFEQALVIGDNRPFISAIVVPATQPWRELAASLGLDPEAPATLENEAARQAVLARAQAATRHFPRYAVPKAIWLTREPWTVENGLITPTLKLKRNALHTRLDNAIGRLYGERKPAPAAR